MARKSTILFNPSLGCRYFVKNVHTHEEVIGKVLAQGDTKWGPIRSGKGTEKGSEFFKMIINDTCFKMMNSNINSKCLSENGEWEFTGEKPFNSTNSPRKKAESIDKNIFVVNEKILNELGVAL